MTEPTETEISYTLETEITSTTSSSTYKIQSIAKDLLANIDHILKDDHVQEKVEKVRPLHKELPDLRASTTSKDQYYVLSQTKHYFATLNEELADHVKIYAMTVKDLLYHIKHVNEVNDHEQFRLNRTAEELKDSNTMLKEKVKEFETKLRGYDIKRDQIEAWKMQVESLQKEKTYFQEQHEKILVENTNLLNSNKGLSCQLDTAQAALGQLVLDYGELISKLSGHMLEGNTSKAKFEYVHGALNEARLQLGTVHNTNNSLFKELEQERILSKQKEDDFRRKEGKLQKELAQKEEEIKKIFQSKIDNLNETIGKKNEEISKITARLETREILYKSALEENNELRANISKLEAQLNILPSPNDVLVDELTVFSKKVKQETEALQSFVKKFFHEAHASLYIQSDIDTLLQVTAATTLELRNFLVQIIDKLNISSSMITSEDIDLINEAEHMRELLNPSRRLSMGAPRKEHQSQPQEPPQGGPKDGIPQGAKKSKAPQGEREPTPGSKKQKKDDPKK